jgi:flagellar protein FliS
MFTQNRNAAKAYATTSLESSAMAANPHKLIAMLYDGALIAILKAEHHMKNKEIIEKNSAINKATDIILMGLDASLNVEAGGEISDNLHALYTFMCQELVLSNLHNDQKKLRVVYDLLLDLKNTWDAIAPNSVKSVPAMPFGENINPSSFIPASA